MNKNQIKFYNKFEIKIIKTQKKKKNMKISQK